MAKKPSEKEFWGISIDAEMKAAAQKYLKEVGRGSASALMQDLLREFLMAKGYWPPKRK